jgi:hypothetical protein
MPEAQWPKFSAWTHKHFAEERERLKRFRSGNAFILFLKRNFQKGGESLPGFVANPQVCRTFFGNFF